MVDILDIKKITIIDKDNYLFKSDTKILESDKTYSLHHNLINNLPHDDILQDIGNDINKTVKFPPKIILDGKTYLFRRKKRTYQYELYKPGTFHDDKIIVTESAGMFVLINLSLDHDENIYINDNPISINPNINVIKLVRKDEKISLNSSISEEHVLLIWFVVYYELSED